MASFDALCLRCFEYGHHRGSCTNHPIVSCSVCFGMNFLTRECCKLEWRPKDEYYQCFRMVGVAETRYFTDVPIINKMVAGLIDTNRSTSIVDWAVFNKLKSEDPNFRYVTGKTCIVKIPKPHISVLECKVALLTGDLRIVLGMDFLCQRHVELKLDGTLLVPTVNRELSRSANARYNLDVQIGSIMFTGTIDTSLTQSQMKTSVLKLLGSTSVPFIYDNEHKVCTVSVIWKKREIKMPFKVGKFLETSFSFGTDFLKNWTFDFKLDGIELDIHNPWKTTHQDGLQFAYNHVHGNKLRLALLADKCRLVKDTFRPIIERPSLDRSITQKEKMD